MKVDKRIFIITLIIAFVAVFYILTIREGHDWGDDFSMYLHHAKNISEGKSYGDTGYIYNKYNIVGPKTYPPIFPILLLPVYKVFGYNLLAFKIEIIIFFVLSLFILFLCFKGDLRFIYLASLIAIIGFNPYFWDFKDQVLSDIPFLFFTYLSLYLINQFYDSANPTKQLIYGMVTGFTIAISYGTRTIGFVLVPSIMLYELVKFRRLTKLSIIALVTFIFFVIFNRLFFHNDSSYVDQILLNPEYIIVNIVGYIESFADIWNCGTNTGSIVLTNVIFMGVSFLSILGYINRFNEGPTIYEIFPILYLVIVILWPSLQRTRFLIPIIPLYIFYAIWSLKVIKIEKYIFATLTISILLLYFNAYHNINYGPIPPIGAKETTQLFKYIEMNTNKQDVIIFQKPRLMSFYTDRKSSAYYEPKADSDLWRYFKDIGVLYVVVAPNALDGDGYLLGFINKYREHFAEVYTSSDFKVFKIKTWAF